MYSAGFPIGFNVAISGQDFSGNDATNDLSYIILRAQEHLLLPQPNLSARLHDRSPEHFLARCTQVIGKGGGMPRIFNDEAVIPVLRSMSISPVDARNYAIVGNVGLTTMGNNPGLGDAAIFNIVKALELALNDGRCTLTGKQLGARTGTLEDHETYDDVERALESQIDFFFGRMIHCCEIVDRARAELLPSPFLSSVVDDCMERGLDVTEGGAFYNLSEIQAMQCANVADSLAALKTLVYIEKTVDRTDLYKALLSNFENTEPLRLLLQSGAPKYGDNVEWVDELANKWLALFSEKLSRYTNVRGGQYHTGLYAAAACIPMGANVGATPDGRKAGQPLADGVISPVCNLDVDRSTTALKSAAQTESRLNSNGNQLNLILSPLLFSTDTGIGKLVDLLRTFVELRIKHAQFSVVSHEDMRAAQKAPIPPSRPPFRPAGADGCVHN
jgi:formate C-acetyltransferase